MEAITSELEIQLLHRSLQNKSEMPVDESSGAGTASMAELNGAHALYPGAAISVDTPRQE